MAFLVVLPIAMLLAVIFDKKIEETIALSIFWASLLAYILGILGILIVSKYLIAGAAVVSLVAGGYLAFKKKRLSNVLTAGLLEFLVLCGYYLMVMRGRLIDGQDALRVYERYPSDFYFTDSISRYKNMVGLMMWKYVSMKFWPNFSEGILLFAAASLGTAMLVFIFSFKDEKRDWIKFAAGLFLILYTPLTFRSGMAYVGFQYDFISALTTVYIIVAYKKLLDTRDVFYKIAIISGLAFIVHIKTSGIVLALICVFVILGMEMYLDRKEGYKSYIFPLTCLAVAVVSKLTWSIFCRLHDKSEKFSVMQFLTKNGWAVRIGVVVVAILAVAAAIYILAKKNLKLLMAAITALSAVVFAAGTYLAPAGGRKQTIISFLKIIFDNYAVDRGFGFGTRFQAPYIIVIAGLPILWYIAASAKKDTEGFKQNRMLLILNTFGFLFFAAITYITNSYGRSAKQTVKAKECERYLFTYIAVFILVYGVIILADYSKEALFVPVAGIIALYMFFSADSTILYYQVVDRPEVETYDGLDQVEFDKSDKFFFVDQRKEHVAERFYMEASPASLCKWDQTDLYLDDPDKIDVPRKMTFDEWVEALQTCTYVYLATTDENFAEEYGEIFDAEIVDGRFYHVVKEDGKIRLTAN
jgi:hypothetical protein